MMVTTVEMLQHIVDALTIGVVVVDNDDNIVVFNRMAGEMLQQDPESRIGTSLLLCHPKVWEAEVKKVIGELREGTREEYGGWLNFRGRMLYERIRPMWDEQGKCLGLLDEFYDVEDKVQYLKRLGEWEDIEVSGVGERAPRSPGE